MLAAGPVEHRRAVTALLLRDCGPVVDRPVEMRLRRLKLGPVNLATQSEEMALDARDASGVRVKAHRIGVGPKTEAVPD